MISFKGYCYPKSVILQCVRWYVAYCLSYRDIEEIMKERGIDVDHSTLNRWVLKFSPLLEKEFQKRKRRPGGRVRLDETYLLVKGQWKYLYRAVDKEGNTIDFLLSAKRDKKAAKRFLKKMIKRNGKPSLINIDKSGANHAAINHYNIDNNTRITIRQCKYLNNVIEQDHRFVKRKMKQVMGFETFSSAARTIAGLELWRMLKKGQKRWGGSQSPCALFYALAM
ncbi:IS6 family transposase [Pseudomaricurvus alkylphenolicus]|uniref:IS6 family transposase n=1 Tax=Pseudomaricurvus alkylphenolicus TaxID=1306991 RepID=UPI00141FF928|nr:IS6 family transposase [Pseudomaricurvus alkylphenolicus]